MSLWSHLWSLTLLPLSLVGAFVLAMAWGSQSWLMVACLVMGLFFSIVRLVQATRAHRRQEHCEDSSAAIWRGHEIAVGMGEAYFLKIMTIAIVIGGISMVFLRRGSGHWAAWLALGGSVSFAALIVWRLLQNPGVLLRVGRRGVWDPKFGWVAWDEVDHVGMLEMEIRSTRLSWLVLRLGDNVRLRLAALKSRPHRGLPIAHMTGDGDVMQYHLQPLPVHPRTVETVAKQWFATHRDGQRPALQTTSPQLEQAEAALDQVRRAMRFSTRGVLLSYLLAPLALVADLLIKWGT